MRAGPTVPPFGGLCHAVVTRSAYDTLDPMNARWLVVWAGSAAGAHCMLYYLASTAGDVKQDIGWREALAVAVITAAFALVPPLKPGP